MANPADQTVTVKLRFTSEDAGAERKLRQIGSAAAQTAAAVARVNGQRPQFSAGGGRAPRGVTPSGLPASGAPAADDSREYAQRQARYAVARDSAADPASAAEFRMRLERNAQQDAGWAARAAREGRLEAARESRRDAARALRLEAAREAHDRPLPGTPRYYDQQAVKAEAGYRDRVQHSQEMYARGLNADGSPQIGLDRFLSQPPGQRGLAASAGGFGGRLLGRAAAPLAVAYAGQRLINATTAADQATATPFLRAGASDEAQRNALPFYGDIRRTFTELGRTYRGERQAVRGVTERRELDLQRADLTGGANIERAGLVRDVATTRARAEALSGLRLDRLPAGVDRNALGGMRQYQEASRLLPLQQRLTVASKERAAAEQSAARAAEEERKRKGELAQIEAALNSRDGPRARRVRAAGASTLDAFALQRYEEASAAEAVLDRQREAKLAEVRDATAARRSADERAVGARAGERGASAEVARGRLANAEGREDAARAGARTLGGLGAAGRQEALLAYKLVQRLGVDNLDPDTVALAEQVDPEGVGRLKEAAGERAKGAFRASGPLGAASPALADLGEATRATDRAREGVTRLDERGLSAEARERFEASERGVYEAITRLYGGLEQRLRQFVADRERAAGNGGGA